MAGGLAARKAEKATRTQDSSTGAHPVIERLRAALGIDDAIDDHTILASFAEIVRFDDPFSRVQAAFDSTLGQWLALRGFDLDSALPLMVAEASKPRL